MTNQETLLKMLQEAEQFNQDNELCVGYIGFAIREVKKDIELCKMYEALEETV